MSESSFAALGLRESLVRTLTTLGYETPTPIQERTIPPLLGGRNVLGQAQTGTGKTAAFALPILEKVDPTRRETQALVLTPTRELAVQVAEALHAYAREIPELSVLPVYGGAPIAHQLHRLQRGVQIVVGTPGRLIDHLDRKSLRLGDVRMVVLDEADEMLKMGFKDDVDRILGELPAERQIALFSATMPPEVARIAERHMADALRIEIERKSVTAPEIEQRFINVSEAQKLEVLTKLLELEENEAVLVFRRTKTGSAELAERLVGRGFAAEPMHGDMNQRERESVIRRLKAGQLEVVVATDVAARGLDVEQITHVVNYDVPWDVEAYVHRIGRTGRAGRTGVATLFITPRERKMMREIERFTGAPIKPMKMPTAADVAAMRIGALKETVRKAIEEGDLEMYLDLVEQLVDEGQHDLAEIAAAAVRIASVARPIREEPAAPVERPAPPPRAERQPGPAPAFERPRRARDDGAAPERPRHAPAAGSAAERPRRPYAPAGQERAGRSYGAGPKSPYKPAGERPPRTSSGPRVRLSMAVGKRDGIRPADVVGSIANEAGIPGRDIGPIEIRDAMTFVEVPADAADRVIETVGRARFHGRAVNLKRADEREAERPARKAFDRQSERPPRKAFDRDAERPPRKPFYADRPGKKPRG